jgi:hypothetical protein
MSEEQTFLQSGAAVITSSRIVIGNQTFATRNVGSVSVQEIPRKSLGCIAFGLVAVAGLLAKEFGVAVVCGVISAVFFLMNKPSYKLVMMAGGGEVVALVSKDQQHIRQLHDAVAQAISVR